MTVLSSSRTAALTLADGAEPVGEWERACAAVLRALGVAK